MTGTKLSSDALETSKLIVELLHAAHASQGPRGAAAHLNDADSPREQDSQLSPHAIRAAIHLYQHGECTIGELATGLGISLGWASRVAEELEKSGHFVRERDPGDRRVVRLHLAPSAIAEVERAYRWRGDAVERALETLAPPERAALRVFLRRLIDELGSSVPDSAD